MEELLKRDRNSSTLKARDCGSETEEKAFSLKISEITDTQMHDEKKKVHFCNRNLIHPDKKFKFVFDLVIIIFSVWNSILIPYQAAYKQDTGVIVSVIDRFIDVAFFFDIFVNFRTIYKDQRTDEEVKNWKKIGARYLFQGRFLIDILASMPLEVL